MTCYFVSSIAFPEIDGERAEQITSALKEMIYDHLDETGEIYQVLGSGMVDGDAPIDPPVDEPQIGGFRATDPDTSRKGAIDAYPRSGKHRHRALIALAQSGDHGMTYEEVERETGIKSVWKRLSELKDGGWIRESGERLIKSTRSMGTIWKITEKAERQIELKENSGVLA